MVEEFEGVIATLIELGIIVPLPMQILSDNQGIMFVVNNPICHSKLKHVTMDLHFVREKREEGTLSVKHISDSLQKADILTKSTVNHSEYLLQTLLFQFEGGGVLTLSSSWQS